MNDSVNTIYTNSSEIIKSTKKSGTKKKIQVIKYTKAILFISFTILGFLNHLGFYLIMTSSQHFATKLGNENLIAFYPLALILFSSFSRVLNSKYFINLSYFIRLIFLSFLFFIGYISYLQF